MNNKLAFLLGVPRSGTTLLSVLLNQHSHIYCPPEPWLLIALDMLGKVAGDHPADSPFLREAINSFEILNQVSLAKESALAVYNSVLSKTGRSLFVDKTPRYYQVLNLVKDFKNEAKFIVIYRNPLDVAASYKTTWGVNIPEIIKNKANSPFLFDYILGFNNLLAFESEQQVLRINYEQLVINPQETLEKVFSFLDLPSQTIDINLNLSIAGHNKSIFGDDKIRGNTQVHNKSVDSYKDVFNPKEQLILINALGSAFFNQLGYQHIIDSYKLSYPIAKIKLENKATFITANRLFDERLANTNQYFTYEDYMQTKNSNNDMQNSLIFANENISSKNQAVEKLAIDNLSLNNEIQKAGVEIASLNERLELLISQNNGLNERFSQASIEIANLNQKINLTNSMGFSERWDSFVANLNHKVKYFFIYLIWGVARGSAPKNLPKISIVTPVFNSENYIAETIQSVLTQSYPNIEFIIVDGDSTDRTLDIIKEFQSKTIYPHQITKVISEPDNGMYDAIAKGFANATGEIFCYLNSDDTFECDGLSSVGRFFAHSPKENVLYHEDTVLVNGWKYPNIRQPENIKTHHLLAGHILFQDGVFFRRSAYEAVGGLNRTLKFAGDYDLWLKLSGKYKFIRSPNHVSCFRVRAGQLSLQMEKYCAEMQLAKDNFLAKANMFLKIWWYTRRLMSKVSYKLISKLKKERLFFPIDFANMPPPVVTIPPNCLDVPLSPIDGKPAERLLFSTPDTRFGDTEINYIYLDARHQVTITHPPIDNEKLDMLYKQYYSTPSFQIKMPVTTSPYRNFNGKNLIERLILKIPTQKFARFMPNTWLNPTLDELRNVLAKSGLNISKPLRLLDTGCFDGQLLDAIKDTTVWKASGLEPNDKAAKIASDKGHEVWQCHAEDALETIPKSRQFDVVFMGQSIEHVSDPIKVIRRLRQLLAPGGIVVLSTPNLESTEVDWFGPTWAHWHTPYHRFIFSQKSLLAIAEKVGLINVYSKTFSHPYWTAMSVTQNKLGLGAALSHTVDFEMKNKIMALRINFYKNFIFRRKNKGDYIYFVMKEGVSA